MASVAVVVGLVMILFFQRFVLVAFDPVGAEAAGFPVLAFQSLLLTTIAVAIVISIQAVGVVLVVALLITPAATANLLTKNLKTLILLSSAFGLMSAFLGLYISYFWCASRRYCCSCASPCFWACPIFPKATWVLG